MSRRACRGISTPELLVGSMLSLMTVAVMFSTFKAQSRAFAAQTTYSQSQTVTRTMIDRRAAAHQPAGGPEDSTPVERSLGLGQVLPTVPRRPAQPRPQREQRHIKQAAIRPAGLQQRHARTGGGQAAGDDAPGRPGTDDDVVERPCGPPTGRDDDRETWRFEHRQALPTRRFASRARIDHGQVRASRSAPTTIASCEATTSAVSRHRPTDDGRCIGDSTRSM